jgi:hypothetical protein
MGKYTLENEGDSFEAAVRMRTEWQALVAGRIDLRAMMVEKQKCAKAI